MAHSKTQSPTGFYCFHIPPVTITTTTIAYHTTTIAYYTITTTIAITTISWLAPPSASRAQCQSDTWSLTKTSALIVSDSSHSYKNFITVMIMNMNDIAAIDWKEWIHDGEAGACRLTQQSLQWWWYWAKNESACSSAKCQMTRMAPRIQNILGKN